MGSREFHDQIWALWRHKSHMGEMRDSDWSRPKILRSDWLGLIGSIITTGEDAVILHVDDLATKIFGAIQLCNSVAIVVKD